MHNSQILTFPRRLPAPFYFLHIPKTGGTSLGSHLLSQCPEKLVLNCLCQEMLSFSRSKIQSFSYFAGHFGTLLLDRLDKSLRLFTMLRDPFERTLSSIRYGQAICRQHPSPLQTPLVRDALINQSIDDIISDPYLSLFFVNSQVLHLGCNLSWHQGMLSLKPVRKATGSTEETSTGSVPPPYLEVFFVQHLQSGELDMNSLLIAAKKQLSQMDVIGILEHFSDSAALISRALGIRKPATMPMLNIAPSRGSNHLQSHRSDASLSADAIKRIDELNGYEHDLYDFGLDLFRRQQARMRRRFFFSRQHG